MTKLRKFFLNFYTEREINKIVDLSYKLMGKNSMNSTELIGDISMPQVEVHNYFLLRKRMSSFIARVRGNVTLFIE